MQHSVGQRSRWFRAEAEAGEPDPIHRAGPSLIDQDLLQDMGNLNVGDTQPPQDEQWESSTQYRVGVSRSGSQSRESGAPLAPQHQQLLDSAMPPLRHATAANVPRIVNRYFEGDVRRAVLESVRAKNSKWAQLFLAHAQNGKLAAEAATLALVIATDGTDGESMAELLRILLPFVSAEEYFSNVFPHAYAIGLESIWDVLMEHMRSTVHPDTQLQVFIDAIQTAASNEEENLGAWIASQYMIDHVLTSKQLQDSLEFASHTQNTRVMGMLFDAGVDLNAHNGRILYDAVRERTSSAYLKFLLDHGVEPYYYDEDGASTILAAVQLDEYQLAIYFLEYFDDFLPVHLNDAFLHIMANAEVHQPMIETFDLAEKLLLAGADIDYQNGLALQRAVDASHGTVVNYLLDHGASVTGNEDHLLMKVVTELQDPDWVYELLQKGANPNARNGEVLLRAVQADQVEIVQLLLSKGGDPNLCNGLAFRLAERKRNRKMMALLRAYKK